MRKQRNTHTHNTVHNVYIYICIVPKRILCYCPLLVLEGSNALREQLQTLECERNQGIAGERERKLDLELKSFIYKAKEQRVGWRCHLANRDHCLITSSREGGTKHRGTHGGLRTDLVWKYTLHLVRSENKDKWMTRRKWERNGGKDEKGRWERQRFIHLHESFTIFPFRWRKITSSILGFNGKIGKVKWREPDISWYEWRGNEWTRKKEKTARRRQ